ncbi:hypothetical protein AB6A40_006376 [Gnathostoma spinigerum]
MPHELSSSCNYRTECSRNIGAPLCCNTPSNVAQTSILAETRSSTLASVQSKVPMDKKDDVLAGQGLDRDISTVADTGDEEAGLLRPSTKLSPMFATRTNGKMLGARYHLV